MIFLFANPHCFRFLIFSFIGRFDEKSFLVFLVSEKLDAKLSDNLFYRLRYNELVFLKKE
ncbi:hypothetical protein D8X56_04635 [Helicobacter pylori]|nr:hypothetical protein D8X56_04635 [Helicobacter pylori]